MITQAFAFTTANIDLLQRPRHGVKPGRINKRVKFKMALGSPHTVRRNGLNTAVTQVY